MSRLSNKDVVDLEKDIASYQEEVVDSTYEYFKKITDFVFSRSLKGSTGDAVMNYFDQVHMHFITRIMNVADELFHASMDATDIFLAYEESMDGLVDSGYVEEKRREIRSIFTDFQSHETKLKSIENQILGIPGVKSTNPEAVATKFEETNDVMNEIKEDLRTADNDLYNRLNQVQQRVRDLKTAIAEVDQNYKTSTGFSIVRVDNMHNEDWYTNESADVFSAKFAESPYEVSGDVNQSYVQEFVHVYNNGQGVYGISANERGYFWSRDGNTRTGEAHYTGFEGRATYESDYVNSDARLQVGHAEGSIEVSEQGFDARGNVGVAQVSSEVVLGTDNLNVHADGEAGFLTADGKLMANDTGVAATATAAFAYAEVSGGVTILGFDIDASLAAGKVGGGFEFSTERIELELYFLGGGRIGVDLPSSHPLSHRRNAGRTLH